MALNYTDFYAMVRSYCRAYAKITAHTTDFNTLIEDQITAGATLDDVAYYSYLKDLLDTDKARLAGDTSFHGQFLRRCSNFLSLKGRDLAQSAQTDAALIMTDVATFMTRDSQTVLQNGISNSIAYSRSGDGTVTTFTQNQFTRNDVITLSCTTAQTGVIDAIFSVRTDHWGALTATVTADNSTTYTDATLGKHLGITALKVGKGTLGPSMNYYWAVGDQITITTTSTDAGIILSAIRDMYDVLLPSAAIPTIAD